MGAVAEALGGVDVGAGETPDPAALAKLAQIDAAEATAASTNISTWVTENCTARNAVATSSCRRAGVS